MTTIEYLRQWQEQYGTPNKELLDELGIEAYSTGLTENMNRLGSPNDLRDIKLRDEDEEGRSTAAFLDPEDTMDEDLVDRMLKVGDLVEIRYIWLHLPCSRRAR